MFPSLKSSQVYVHSKNESPTSEERSQPASLRNVCSWNLATMLGGSTSSHMERPLFQPTAPAEVPADSQHQIAKDVRVSLQMPNHPSLQIFPAEAPDIIEHKQTVLLCSFQILNPKKL